MTLKMRDSLANIYFPNIIKVVAMCNSQATFASDIGNKRTPYGP